MIELSTELCVRCTEFGFALHRFYASRPQEGQIIGGKYITAYQRAAAKTGECIGAIFFELDPLKVVDFSIGQNDDGSDFTVGRTRVDIKTNHFRGPGRWLRWPLSKNYRYDHKQFDAFVLVYSSVSWINDVISHAAGEPIGWIGKRSFKRQRLFADEAHRLDTGTSYLPEEKLHAMDVFPGRSSDPREHYCWCGEPGFLGYRDSDQFVCCEQHMPQL